MEESVGMAEDRDKWRKYVHGVSNHRLKNRTDHNLAVFPRSAVPYFYGVMTADSEEVTSLRINLSICTTKSYYS